MEETKMTPSAAYRKGLLEGYLQALEDFAVWYDGVQKVGCGVLSLKQAQREAKEKYLQECPQCSSPLSLKKDGEYFCGECGYSIYPYKEGEST